MANEKELKLHDGTALLIPSGWTVEIEKTLESSAASLSDGTGYAKVTPTIIARLIPSENAQGEIKYMHDRECRRQKDEGVLCQDHCYFKTSGLKECPVKSGIVVTGISEAEQHEALAFLNEDDWTVPESGENAEHIPQWIIDYDAKNFSSSAGKAIRILMNKLKSVSLPPQAESDESNPLLGEVIYNELMSTGKFLPSEATDLAMTITGELIDGLSKKFNITRKNP